jgi:hypothetical protein
MLIVEALAEDWGTRPDHCQPWGVLPCGLELRCRHPQGDRVKRLG